MEPPAKRQRISQAGSFPAPSRTINLDSFQRPIQRRNRPGKIVLPRIPDVTVTAAVLEVAVNEGSMAVQVTAAPTETVAVTLGDMGTVTVPPLESASLSTAASTQTSTSSQSNHGSGDSGATSSGAALTTSSSHSSNSTITSGDRTVTVTATNTFHISYNNGTFITPAQTFKTRPTSSHLDGSQSSDSSTNEHDPYTFGQSLSGTYGTYNSFDSIATATHHNVNGSPATGTVSSPTPSSTGQDDPAPAGPVLTPEQTQMVGGIVGGVAGVALVLVVILYVMRWYRQRMKSQIRLPERLGAGDENDHDSHEKTLASMAAPISRTTRSPFFAPLALKNLRPQSGLTVDTTSTGADSEKGFQRISGRKIASVLSTGGDQYGGSFGVFENQVRSPNLDVHDKGSRHLYSNRDMSEMSFYRDTDGNTYGGTTPSTPTNPFADPVTLTPTRVSNSQAVYVNHSRPPFNSARRPSIPYSATSTVASPTFASPYTQHAHKTSAESTDSQFDPTTFDAAFQRNIAVLSDLTSSRPKPDGFAVSRNSPARTPVIQSPGAITLKVPMAVGYTMDSDVPEMPLPSPGLRLGPSGLSAVTSGIDKNNHVGGRFREIDLR